jgi:hypothetical protein
MVDPACVWVQVTGKQQPHRDPAPGVGRHDQVNVLVRMHALLVTVLYVAMNA